MGITPKISVIIPIYNVERYIARCARTLFSQNLEDIEYIFVDDCSPDESVKVLCDIIDEYPHRKPYIKVIHHEVNKGLPQARKTGVLNSTGTYIAHCDSDDWVDTNMYKIMYNVALENNADIVISNYFRSNGVTKTLVKQNHNKQKILQGPIWNKIIKRSLYFNNNIIYPIANKAEDGALMTQLSYYSQKEIYIDKPLYYYYINNDSICNSNSIDSCIKKYRDECENVSLRINFLREKSIMEQHVSDIILWKFAALNNLLPNINNKECYDLYISTYPELIKDIFRSRQLKIILTYYAVRFRLGSIVWRLKSFKKSLK